MDKSSFFASSGFNMTPNITKKVEQWNNTHISNNNEGQFPHVINADSIHYDNSTLLLSQVRTSVDTKDEILLETEYK